MPGPLADVFVLDLSRVLAGPFCTMILADLGAEVVKVERPGTGDDSRAFSPMKGPESAYFMSINRGKKSITVNMKSPKGKDIILNLAKHSDVVVENFKPGVTKRLGLSYETLRQVNPRIIYASSTGYGQTGPLSEKAAYDLIIQGMSGMMSITGQDENHPTKVGSSIADIFSGVFTCIGILSALRARERTGEGQMVDVAMLDCMFSVLENAVARFMASGVVPGPIGNLHPSIAPFSSFNTSDGQINIAVGNDSLWTKFCKAIGREELLSDERYRSNDLRIKNLDSLMITLNASLMKRRSQDWLNLFEETGIPAGKVDNIAEVLKNPQIIARNMLVNLVHPTAGEHAVPGIPIKFSSTDASIKGSSPLLGEHNKEILIGLLGMSNNELSELEAEGVI